MYRHSKTLEHETDFRAGDALASEKKVRQQFKLTLRDFGPKALDTLNDCLCDVVEVVLKQCILARKIIEQVAGCHSRRLRHVTQCGFRVPLGDDAIMESGQDSRATFDTTGT